MSDNSLSMNAYILGVFLIWAGVLAIVMFSGGVGLMSSGGGDVVGLLCVFVGSGLVTFSHITTIRGLTNVEDDLMNLEYRVNLFSTIDLSTICPHLKNIEPLENMTQIIDALDNAVNLLSGVFNGLENIENAYSVEAQTIYEIAENLYNKIKEANE